MNKLLNKYIAKNYKNMIIVKDKDLKMKDFNESTGLKLKKVDALKLINDEISRQEYIRNTRRKNKPDIITLNRILNMQNYRNRRLEIWNYNLRTAKSLSDSIRHGISISGEISNYRIRVNDTDLLIINSDCDTDWNYYSRSYKHPKVTISNRRVELHRFNKSINTTLVKTYNLDSFKGSFIINAVIALYDIPELTYKGLSSVQLNKHFTVTKLKDICGVQVYQRSFLDIVIDYCAVKKGTTYHSHSYISALNGLRNKLKAKTDKTIKLINYSYCRRLGFCHTGIVNFTIDNNISIDDEFTTKQLKEIVTKDIESNMKYRNELKKVGVKI